MNSAATSLQPPADAQGSVLRILFLAARPEVVTTLRHTLEPDAGIELHAAADPDEVLAMARCWLPDLILFDLPWAGRSGQRLVASLRVAQCLPRLAVLGDLSGARAREAARGLGASGFTPDPRSPDLLKVVRALARPQARRRAGVTAA